MMKTQLDMYDRIPEAQRLYLSHNGWHFNKKACDLATRLMKKHNTATNKLERIEPWTRDEVDSLLTKYGIVLERNTLYDYVYVANMAKADFYKSSLPDEQHIALYVKDYVDDIDGGDGFIMRRWYASMVANGEPVEWEEIL